MGFIKLSDGYADLSQPPKVSRPSQPSKPPKPPRIGQASLMVNGKPGQKPSGPKPAEPAQQGLPNRFNLTKREYGAISRRHGADDAQDIATASDFSGLLDPSAGYDSSLTAEQMAVKRMHDHGYNSAMMKIKSGGMMQPNMQADSYK